MEYGFKICLKWFDSNIKKDIVQIFFKNEMFWNICYQALIKCSVK